MSLKCVFVIRAYEIQTNHKKRENIKFLFTNEYSIYLFCFVLEKNPHPLPLKAMLLRKQSRMTTMLDQEGGGGVSKEICGTVRLPV